MKQSKVAHEDKIIVTCEMCAGLEVYFPYYEKDADEFIDNHNLIFLSKVSL